MHLQFGWVFIPDEGLMMLRSLGCKYFRASFQEMGGGRYVLYINNSHRDEASLCEGSKLCMSAVNGRKDFIIQNVQHLIQNNVNLPEWLDGTPCLVDKETSQAYKGTAAVNFAKSVGKSNASSPKYNAAPNTRGPVHSDEVGIQKDRRVVQEVHGTVALNERRHFDTDDMDPASGFKEIEEVPEDQSDAKVTEGSLQAYMALREKSV
jgi:hypothetical protein